MVWFYMVKLKNEIKFIFIHYIYRSIHVCLPFYLHTNINITYLHINKDVNAYTYTQIPSMFV